MNRISALVGLSIAILMPHAAEAQGTQDTVPFVGCPADGQTGYFAPPRGSPKVVDLHGVSAQSVAYYEGKPGPGVFAPRGWHCQVAYGSAGSTIVVTPDFINLLHHPAPRVSGHAVELALSLAGTSGRFRVAAYASRLFPNVIPDFIGRVKSEGLVTDSDLAAERYRQDSVSNLGHLLVAFVTPAGVNGLGTAGYLEPSADAIRGLAAIVGDLEEPDMAIVRLRLGASMQQLEVALLRLNGECMQRPGGC
ncbi:MAG: hypothetical protein OER90_16820 [Gemmatimonadota bacterium]|nr:hypothetical protein [Gemmatimonadota bacterium]